MSSLSDGVVGILVGVVSAAKTTGRSANNTLHQQKHFALTETLCSNTSGNRRETAFEVALEKRSTVTIVATAGEQRQFSLPNCYSVK